MCIVNEEESHAASVLAGVRNSKDGSFIATVSGTTVTWAEGGGPPSSFTYKEDTHEISMEGAIGHESNGYIKWDDGDEWFLDASQSGLVKKEDELDFEAMDEDTCCTEFQNGN